MSLVYFYTPWRHQKTRDFLIFQEVRYEIPIWHELVHRAYSKKKGHVRDFSEKGPKKGKYLKMWGKMYKT